MKEQPNNMATETPSGGSSQAADTRQRRKRQAAGLSMDDLKSIATEAMTGMTDSVTPLIEDVRYRLQLA